ncbi:hypothetical protein [Lachnoclostridium sp.]|uniref:hypothetical protein n=1 Tax=Lachnoclostridium sp. TaxID=2028282 RepID=UPI0026D8ADC0|nr:hypothetical protein [Lachnoclostridium sp.]
MNQYTETQIIKHALQAYIKRPDATDRELNQEKTVLKKYTEEAEKLKERYRINS